MKLLHKGLLGVGVIAGTMGYIALRSPSSEMPHLISAPNADSARIAGQLRTTNQQLRSIDDLDEDLFVDSLGLTQAVRKHYALSGDVAPKFPELYFIVEAACDANGSRTQTEFPYDAHNLGECHFWPVGSHPDLSSIVTPTQQRLYIQRDSLQQELKKFDRLAYQK